MQAIHYYGVKNLGFVDIPKPTAEPGQALVKVKYCGICGTDIHAYSMPGIFNWELVPGHESVGVVEAVGEGVSGIAVGDRVAVGPPGDCGSCYPCNTGHPNTCIHAFPNTLGIGPGTQGAYAEYVLSKHPHNELFKIPDGVSFEQAVLFDVLGVGLHAVRLSQLRVGDCAVVVGCGSIGLATLQFARMAGAAPLLAFDTDAARRRLALEAGADYALDPQSSADVERAKSLCAHSAGAQVCYEAAGNPAAVQTCVDLCMPNGQVLLIGSDGRPYELVTAALGPRQLDFKLAFTYTREEIHTLFALIESGKLDVSLYKTEKVPLEKGIEAMDELAAGGRRDVARVLLEP